MLLIFFLLTYLFFLEVKVAPGKI